MSYTLHLTKSALIDINMTAEYIENTLKNPSAADHLINEAEKSFKSILIDPYSRQLIDDPVLNTWGYRFIVIGNYLAFYVIDEEKETVYITRFLYKKRNWIKVLKEQ